jgi:von Willebrand factor type A domain
LQAFQGIGDPEDSYTNFCICETQAEPRLPTTDEILVRMNANLKEEGLNVIATSLYEYGVEPNLTGCLNEMTLDNSATLSAKIISLLNGAMLQTSDSIEIGGNVSIGQGADQGAQDHWTYVIDISGSTDFPCVPGNDTFGIILDCEKKAVLDLHAQIEASGSAVDFGLTSFSDSATPAIFNGSFVTTDRGIQDGDIVREVNKLTSLGGTNYTAGLEEAAVSINASSASFKHIVFISDGEGEEESGFEAALMTLENLGATIYSFAVGSASSCNGGSHGTLQKMADATGGVCRNVTNAADLGDELENLVTSKMMKDSLTVDGSSVVATHTKTLPFDGPGVDQLSYTVPALSLAAGSHQACISATGRGPADILASEQTVGCCVTFEVKA